MTTVCIYVTELVYVAQAPATKNLRLSHKQSAATCVCSARSNSSRKRKLDKSVRIVHKLWGKQQNHLILTKAEEGQSTSMLRNPLERLVSACCDKIEHPITFSSSDKSSKKILHEYLPKTPVYVEVVRVLIPKISLLSSMVSML